METLLLKGGVVLIHDHNDKVAPTRADVLIKGNIIAEIGSSLAAPSGCDVIDCTDSIVSPGFVDTHHHLWQAPLKGLFGDMAFIPYMGVIMTCPFSFKPQDLFWSNLAGALEAVDAGTTTVLDHAHCNYSKDHSQEAIAGTITSGIRSIFAYGPTGVMTSAPPKPEWADYLPDWLVPTMEKLSKTRALTQDDALVRLGFSFDGWFLPKQVVVGLFDKVKSLGVKVITSHYCRFKGEKSPRLPELLKQYSLLERGIVLSHAGGATAEDATIMKEAGAYVSVTPNTEMAMSVGPPVVFRHDLPDMDSVCSFGIDCHSATSSSLVNEMRMGLQLARAHDSLRHYQRGELPKDIYHTTHEAFNMGTINGARALRMENEIGTVAVGKKADLVVFSASSPAMFGAAQQDPVMAIVLHSSIGDVEHVLIDGKIRKKNGKLLPVEKAEWDEDSGEFVQTKDQVGWREVSAWVLDIQQQFVTKLKEFDIPQIQEVTARLFHLI
ncbi:hypothetical protein NM208_g663 [Fusarium decemcellulare]|uniref:Uncharacterized protein n=1 Tax=Fusarium decemcellulare TaxID=57161 RepID=A0ACC1SZ01_9HYPO|nr:hypothetical protein NM208_g663 [Fusarium decemcellulare]